MDTCSDNTTVLEWVCKCFPCVWLLERTNWKKIQGQLVNRTFIVAFYSHILHTLSVVCFSCEGNSMKDAETLSSIWQLLRTILLQYLRWTFVHTGKCAFVTIIRDLIKANLRGWQCQCWEARKIFLHFIKHIFTLVILYVSIFNEILTPASPPEQNDNLSFEDGAVEVSFESRAAKLSA